VTEIENPKARTTQPRGGRRVEARRVGNRHSDRHAPCKAGSATCVQRFDDSLDSAIRITYRISLRSSSLWEPRHPLLKVVGIYIEGLFK